MITRSQECNIFLLTQTLVTIFATQERQIKQKATNKISGQIDQFQTSKGSKLDEVNP